MFLGAISFCGCKLKQVYHLYQFIEPLLQELQQGKEKFNLVDHGAGKSYLGFILYDLFFKQLANNSTIYGIETRDELVLKSQELAAQPGFNNMSFLNLSVTDSISSSALPEQIDIVTALHACNTATDDAIAFGLHKNAKYMVLVPCCQAEVAAILKKNYSKIKDSNILAEIWHHPIHSREFGSHITNVLRTLQLEAHGYNVTVTELVGWEHSMKNELILAKKTRANNPTAAQKLAQLLGALDLTELTPRFS
ncbi:MAG: SAM-dependent methyltransferase [Neisseriales bacterium]|nr:MAG: SAM-dependent methyltransferase [Neisseriales bacterium]